MMYDVDQDGPQSFSVWYMPTNGDRVHMASFFRSEQDARIFIAGLEEKS